MNEPSSNAPEGATDPDISEEEVEALLEKVEPDGAMSADESGRGVVESYDLIAPEKILRARMPALDRVNERWVERFQRVLVELLRRAVSVSVEESRVVAYNEWWNAIGSSSRSSILSVQPWRGSALVAVGEELLFLLVESYYGGGGRAVSQSQRRKLTPAEARFNRILIENLTELFAEAFEPIAKIHFESQQLDANFNYGPIATPSESVVVIQLQISFNESTGPICLLLPLSLLEPVREELAESLKTVSPESRDRWYQDIVKRLEMAELDISSVFLNSEISMRELLSLKPGDILPIEMPKTTVLHADNKPLLCGKFGRSRGYNAVSIVGNAPTAWTDDNEESLAHD